MKGQLHGNATHTDIPDGKRMLNIGIFWHAYNNISGKHLRCYFKIFCCAMKILISIILA